jgi:uracil-DNA glycosylase
MRARGGTARPSKASGTVPATDDEIREKYLERAIRELNQLTREIQECELCPRGNLMPVLGSGHPQADIMLLKFAPMPSAPACRARVLEELAIVQPRIVVVMGDEALEELNDLHVPLARQLEWHPGEVQRLTPSVDALTVPDIDRSLDDEQAKREFWGAFRALGEWYADFPPY